MVPKNQFLLKKNEVKVEGSIKKPKKSELEEQIRAKPNRKILFLMRFHLRTYSFGSSRKKPEKHKKKIRKFLREKVGETPVLFDTASTQKSARNIQQLMFIKGYFNVEVGFELDSGKRYRKRRRRIRVCYIIKPGPVYKVERNDLLTGEFEVDSILDANKSQSLLVPGDQIDFALMSKERSRIDDLMKNNGYFYFGREYIEFDLDTQNHLVKIETVVLSPDDYDYHRAVKLDSIKVVFPSLAPYKKSNNGTEKINNIYYQLNGYPLDKKLIEKRIHLAQNQFYDKSKAEKTYTRLAELRLFKSIDIIFHPSINDSVGYLDVTIYLNPHTKQEYTIEPQGVISYDIQSLAQTNQNRSFGIGNALTYTNRNIFGKAEQFNLSAITSFQAQIGGNSNTIFEQSLNASLNLPGSRILHSLDKNPKVINYSTQINASFVYQRNPDYRRNILPTNFSYLINKKNNNNWLVTPIEINFNRSTVNPVFFNQLTEEQKKFISVLFARNLIASSHLTYYTTRISKKRPQNKWYLKSNVLELGGNSLFAVSQIIGSEKDSLGAFNVLGVPFSQYVRSDLDIRLTQDIDDRNTFVYRLNTGLALPYGNRDFLPVDKRYFIGGANSLRGWNPRAMGPGNLRDTTNSISLDRTAEMLILGNFEYRFDVIPNSVEMAMFFDAGNVWNIVEGEESEKFRLNRFLQSTALNTGLGLRLDFQFFLFRLDWGIRMHNPALDAGQRWIIKDFFKPNFLGNETLLNIGLDYPF